jgi:hypothetical protein
MTDTVENTDAMILKTAEAAKLLRVSEWKIRRMMKQSDNPPPHLRIDGMLRFEREALLNWARGNGTRQRTPKAARRRSANGSYHF